MITQSFDFSNDVFDLFALFKDEPHLFFLDSSLTASTNGRYSFIGFDPFEIVEGYDLESYQRFKNRFLHLQQLDGRSSLPFHAGAVGYLSYDLGMLFQGVGSSNDRRENGLPLFHFGLYDVVLTVDHLDQKLHIASNGFPEVESGARQKRAKERLQKVVERVGHLIPLAKNYVKAPGSGHSRQAVFKSNVTRDEYVRAIGRALNHIQQGDIYEINLSHQVVVEAQSNATNIKPWELYARLRELSPSHFSAFLNAGNHQILSTSPERFLCLKKGIAQIRPMKGTRPRGRTPEEDTVFRQELLHSKKEIAELLMVTDLERNDLGRVCEFGSVRVKEMRTIEEYKTVFQATSMVEGKLRADRNCFDLIEACFPGGSVTGCPKISAMRLIDGLEVSKRGVYTGAFGYIDFSGNLDFNILIRTLLLNEGKVSFHVGGGIVADSDPLMEYDETWVKAKALMECLSSNLPHPRGEAG
jgi:para-aminobenzoate synthetase component 1